jgi:hypothetical protein
VRIKSGIALMAAVVGCMDKRRAHSRDQPHDGARAQILETALTKLDLTGGQLVIGRLPGHVVAKQRHRPFGRIV